MDEEDGSAVRSDPRFAKNARSPRFEFGFGSVDFRYLEADVMLSAQRVLLQEFCDRRVFVQRFDEFDLAVRRVDKADTDTLDGEVESGAVRLSSEHVSIEFEALFYGRRCDADVIETP